MAQATAAASLCAVKSGAELNATRTQSGVKTYTHTQGRDVSRAAAKAEHHITHTHRVCLALWHACAVEPSSQWKHGFRKERATKRASTLAFWSGRL